MLFVCPCTSELLYTKNNNNKIFKTGLGRVTVCSNGVETDGDANSGIGFSVLSSGTLTLWSIAFFSFDHVLYRGSSL